MNKIIITICALCMLCISCTSLKQVNYIIKGTVNNMNGETVFLLTVEDEIDSAIVNNNSFTFKGTQPKICIGLVILNNMRIHVILEDGTINISFDNIENYIYPGKVTGTPTNDIFCTYNEKISVLQLKTDILYMQQFELKEDQKDELATLKKKEKKINDKILAISKEFLNQNLDNIVGAYIFKELEKGPMSNEEFAKILADAPSEMKENYLTKEAIEHRKARIRTEIGQKYTDFKLKDPNDKEVALSDYMEKGKYVLIDFWASWCGPCLGEIPYLKTAYQKYASKGFEIIGVSVDDRKEDWIKCIENKNISWPQTNTKGWRCEGVKLYGIRGIPSTFLIDPDGIIIAKNLRGEEIEKKLSELLN